MRKLVVGFILLLSLPLAGLAEEKPAAAEAAPPITAASVVPTAVPDVAQPVAAVPAATVAAPAASPAAYPPGYLPWKAPQGK